MIIKFVVYWHLSGLFLILNTLAPAWDLRLQVWQANGSFDSYERLEVQADNQARPRACVFRQPDRLFTIWQKFWYCGHRYRMRRTSQQLSSIIVDQMDRESSTVENTTQAEPTATVTTTRFADSCSTNSEAEDSATIGPVSDDTCRALLQSPDLVA